MNQPLAGRVAWITGSARGIGKAIARHLALQGADLALTDVLEDDLYATAKELALESNRKVIHQVLDVTDPVGAAGFVQRTVDELGGLTILVNNAGITRDALMMRMSLNDWERVLHVNLTGSFVCTQAAIKPMMKARYGKIVNIASVVGVMGNAGQANYSASKAGMIALTKSVAKELAGRGVRANAVAPGFIETDMTHQLSPEVKEAYLQAIPLKYLGSSDDIAQVCAFLASAASDYISGQVLIVDGGLHM
ncbi:MAG: 3-oxoacyl-[acyl-carrier-protein] reductase [Calditrichaeota bacterium]|nr:3-oxoacyl-[acyl-carrier-protein] reductase [Calditrichota bacterium]MCB9366488.1 3-oxoacyl-[acyl-carrier-protein] reductase [Calditrichota bacterium]MCB9391254.1 3-oxoacyl-[acyl-carrier-protein] reductase [Calditrichota bacterium]